MRTTRGTFLGVLLSSVALAGCGGDAHSGDAGTSGPRIDAGAPSESCGSVRLTTYETAGEGGWCEYPTNLPMLPAFVRDGFHAAIADGIDCVMTSHPVYPNLDPTRVPATFSRRLVHGLLREEAGFKGVIISDDLEMGAIGETCPIGEAITKTAAAGHDLLLVCHTEPAQRAAAGALLDAYRTGAISTRDRTKSCLAPHRGVRVTTFLEILFLSQRLRKPTSFSPRRVTGKTLPTAELRSLPSAVPE